VRRRTVLGAAAAALAIGLTGCGIPDETKARDLGAGPDPGYATVGGAGQGPPAREDATTKETFVAHLLAAVAGEHGEAEERFKRYLTESGRESFKLEDDGVNVVDLDPRGPEFKVLSEGIWQVTLKVNQVGVLDALGSVNPPVLKETAYTFEIGGTGGADDWYVTKPPPHLLLSTQALTAYYTPRTLYFWSGDGDTLVPDGRYMPNEIDAGRQPSRVVEWLVKGPSAWLEPAVSSLNPESQSLQNVPYPNNVLKVALNAVAAEQQGTAVRSGDMVEQLGIQLMWSLRPYLREALELRIEGQGARTFTPDGRFEAANAAHRPPGSSSTEPERFALYRGKIHRLKGSPGGGGGTEPLPQLLLQQGVNDRLVSAALARETSDDGVLTAAALVTRQDQRFHLRVGSAYGDGARPFRASKAFGQMGRPVWLKAPMNAGLIVVDRRLYRFTPDDADLVRVDLPGIPGDVDDVSAAPDGRRIAVAAGGKVFVLGVTRDGAAVEVRELLRQVPLRLRDVTAVDWSDETKVVAAGTGPDNKPMVWQVSLDGAAVKEHVEDAGGPIQRLVAYPDDPVAAPRITAMYARGGAAYDLAGGNGLIEDGEVIGASGEFDPAQVTAPFFLLD
jgi:Lipoprotein LpqB beta-propeller domain